MTTTHNNTGVINHPEDVDVFGTACLHVAAPRPFTDEGCCGCGLCGTCAAQTAAASGLADSFDSDPDGRGDGDAEPAPALHAVGDAAAGAMREANASDTRAAAVAGRAEERRLLQVAIEASEAATAAHDDAKAATASVCAANIAAANADARLRDAQVAADDARRAADIAADNADARLRDAQVAAEDARVAADRELSWYEVAMATELRLGLDHRIATENHHSAEQAALVLQTGADAADAALVRSVLDDSSDSSVDGRTPPPHPDVALGLPSPSRGRSPFYSPTSWIDDDEEREPPSPSPSRLRSPAPTAAAQRRAAEARALGKRPRERSVLRRKTRRCLGTRTPTPHPRKTAGPAPLSPAPGGSTSPGGYASRSPEYCPVSPSYVPGQ